MSGTLIAKAGLGHPTGQIPASFQFNNDIAQAIEGDRKRIRIQPDNGPTFTPQQPSIKFTLPNDGTLDLRHAVLRFSAVTNGAGGGTTCRFSRDINCIINRLQVKLGNSPVEDIQMYNLLNAIRFRPSATEEAITETGINSAFRGIGSAANRDTWATDASRVYLLNINSPFLTAKPLPLDCVSGFMTLEFTLEQAAKCLEVVAPVAPTYTVSGMELICDVYDMSDSYKSAIKSSSYPTLIKFKGYDYQTQTVVGNSIAMQISNKYTSMNGIIAILRTQADVADQLALDKFELYNGYTTSDAIVTQYQMKFNTDYHPRDPVNCSGTYMPEPLWHLLDYDGDYNNPQGGGFLDKAKFSTAISGWTQYNFMMCLKLDNFYNTGLLTGHNSADVASNTLFNVTLSAAPATTQQIEVFVEHDRILKLVHGQPPVVIY